MCLKLFIQVKCEVGPKKARKGELLFYVKGMDKKHKDVLTLSLISDKFEV